MGAVFYQAEIVQDRLPLLLFEYGIVEIGDSPFSFEETVSNMLKEAGMAVFGMHYFGPHSDRSLPRLKRLMRIKGEGGYIDWWNNGEPDEYPDLGREWIDEARKTGFIAVYQNLMGKGPHSLSNLVLNGALLGYGRIHGR